MSDHQKPWDAHLAFQLIHPLRDTCIRPNHLTTLRLLCGIAAFILLSTGDYLYSNIGALFFVLSNFLDHADGELARLTGHSSKFGHYYDLVSDALVNILLFLGIGLGLLQGPVGIYGAVMGIIAGLSVAAIFHIINKMKKSPDKGKTGQTNAEILKAEDILYLLPLVTALQLDYYFMLLAILGAPAFLLLIAGKFIKLEG